MIDLVGHFFYLSIFIGMLLLKNKNQYGWLFRLVGEIGWVGIGLYLGLTSIWVWGILFAVVDFYGYMKWKS